jgi:hypothetical protein
MDAMLVWVFGTRLNAHDGAIWSCCRTMNSMDDDTSMAKLPVSLHIAFVECFSRFDLMCWFWWVSNRVFLQGFF